MMFSTDCRPFSKENDRSRQVVKPTSVENQVHVVQTQCTEQALANFATVRTRYTASVSTEELHIASVIISSSHTEATCYNQFLNKYNYSTLNSNQTLKSFIQYLTKLNHKLHFNISINYILNKT